MIEPRARQFEERYGTTLTHQLGFGFDGTVMVTRERHAVKFFTRPEAYGRELRAYQLIQENGITEILGHQVPELIRWDDELQVIEMSIVQPPFLLDFAGAYPEDDAPDFPPEVWEEWRADKAEQFGERWPDADRIIDEFRRRVGLVLLDVNPGNIKFGDAAGQ
jgi:hypothetical protein